MINLNEDEIEISKQVKITLDNNQDLHNELLSIFKQESHAISWLTSTKVPLGNITPLSLINTTDGKKKVLDMLYRIKTGDFS